MRIFWWGERPREPGLNCGDLSARQEPRPTKSINPLRDLVFEYPLLHPAHGEQIVERREQPVPHAVIALPGEARIVAHLDFRDRVAFDLEQRRQETVHRS